MHLLINNVAINLKKPTSSKKIDKTVIEKKIINIFIGLIDEEDVIPSSASLIVKFENNKPIITINVKSNRELKEVNCDIDLTKTKIIY